MNNFDTVCAPAGYERISGFEPYEPYLDGWKNGIDAPVPGIGAIESCHAVEGVVFASRSDGEKIQQYKYADKIWVKV